MVVLSLLVLVAAMIRATRRPVRAWKSSSLALLFTDVDQKLRSTVTGAMEEFEGIEKVAGRRKVVLAEQGCVVGISRLSSLCLRTCNIAKWLKRPLARFTSASTFIEVT